MRLIDSILRANAYDVISMQQSIYMKSFYSELPGIFQNMFKHGTADVRQSMYEMLRDWKAIGLVQAEYFKQIEDIASTYISESVLLDIVKHHTARTLARYIQLKSCDELVMLHTVLDEIDFQKRPFLLPIMCDINREIKDTHLLSHVDQKKVVVMMIEKLTNVLNAHTRASALIESLSKRSVKLVSPLSFISQPTPPIVNTHNYIIPVEPKIIHAAPSSSSSIQSLPHLSFTSNNRRHDHSIPSHQNVVQNHVDQRHYHQQQQQQQITSIPRGVRI
jgi:hypothetical protein